MALKAGFIGFGRMGVTHYSILNSHPEVEIVAVSDRSNTMLRIVEKYLGTKTYTDYQQMIETHDLDFVIISTPTDSHSEIIDYTLTHNLNTFTEKPFTLNPEDGRNNLNKLKTHPVVNQVGYVNRFNEIFMEVKELIESGILGSTKSYVSEMFGATVLKDAKSSWRGKKKMGGGCMYEFASHCIDLAIYLFGKPDRVAGSILQSIYSSGVEDLVCSNFIYDAGFSGTILVNWSDESYRKPANTIKIWGTKGRLIADKHAYKIYLREADPEGRFEKGWNTRYITDFAQNVRFYVRGNEFTRQLDYFVNAILNNNSENISGFASAYQTDEIMDAIRMDANAKTHSTEPVEPFASHGVTDAEKRSGIHRLRNFFLRK